MWFGNRWFFLGVAVMLLLPLILTVNAFMILSTVPETALQTNQPLEAGFTPAPARLSGPDGLHRAAVEMYDAGHYGVAEFYFRQAVIRQPARADLRNNLGLVLAAQQKWDQAQTAYAGALAIDGELAQTYYNLGVAFEQRGMTKNAVAAYKEAIRIDETLTAPYLVLGKLYYIADRPEAAQRVLQSARQQDPAAPDVALALAIVMANEGELLRAVGVLESALDYTSDHAESYLHLGQMYLAQSRPQAARVSLERALELAPETAVAAAAAALLQELNG